jgi:hypothetical protein
VKTITEILYDRGHVNFAHRVFFAFLLYFQRSFNVLLKIKHSDSTKKLSETEIIYMLELLIDNTFVIFGGRVFQQTVGIPMGANCMPTIS